MARNDEFNRDLDSYLRNRRVVKRTNPFLSARNYFKTLLSAKPKKQEQPLEDIPQEQVNALLAQNNASKPVVRNTPLRPSMQQTKPAPATPTRSTPTPAPTKQVNKMGWFSKKQKEEDYEMMEAAPATQPVLDEDVKEVLKITFKWLKQMDPEQIEDIKRSPDFEKYKRVLDKYGLIKK